MDFELSRTVIPTLTHTPFLPEGVGTFDSRGAIMPASGRWPCSRDSLLRQVWLLALLIPLVGLLLAGYVFVDRSVPRAQYERRRDLWWKTAFSVLTGVVVGLMFVQLDNQRFRTAEALENTRFVRQLALTDVCQLPLRRLHLADMSLARLDLSGADLADSNLAGADLTLVDLSGANLEGADLSGATLREANLKGANLSRVDLSEADVLKADLSETRLTLTKMLVRSDLSKTTLMGVRWNPRIGLAPEWPRSVPEPANAWDGTDWSYGGC